MNHPLGPTVTAGITASQSGATGEAKERLMRAWAAKNSVHPIPGFIAVSWMT
jgi:hypothetical protein